MDETDGLEEILKEVEDEELSLFRTRFCKQGRGRRKEFPTTMTPTNRQLLQLYHLKSSMNKSWDYLIKWGSYLCPHYPSTKFRALIERTIRLATKCLPAERPAFYEKTHNLDCIGPFSWELGLTRSELKDPTSFLTKHLTIGAVIELHEEIPIDELLQVIETIHPRQYNKEQLHKSMNVWKKYSQRNTRKKVQQFKSQTIVVSQACDDKENEVANQQQPEATSHEEEPKKEPQGRGEHKESDQQEKIKKKTLDSLENNLKNEKEKFEIIETAYKKKCIETDSLEFEVQALTKNHDAALCNLDVTQRYLDECRAKLDKANKELTELKGTTQYASLKRKIRYQQNKNETQCETKIKVSNLKGNISQLRSEKQKLNQTVNNKKQQLDRYVKEGRSLKDQAKKLKEEVCQIGAEYMSVCDETLETKGDSRGNPFHENIEKCVMELVGELGVSGANAGPVIGCVAKWVFGKEVPAQDLPKPTVVNSMIDRAHVLAKIHIAETLLNRDRYDLHVDLTTRDHHRILGQQLTTDQGESLSCGYSPLSVETAQTLLDNAIMMVDELADVYSDDEKPTVFRSIMKSMFASMTDRAAVNKLYNSKLSEKRKELVDDDLDLIFLYCNAHFLLGLSNGCETVLKKLEATFPTPLGRDKSPRFSRFSSSSESSVARFIRTGCDVLGPRGDAKSGCRDYWEAFCEKHLNCKSRITSFRMNRFNNFFLGAAGLFFQREPIIEFLKSYKDNPNLKLDSVLLDAQCQELQALVRAVGLIYYVVTGPFWLLLQSDTEYVDLFEYIQRMHRLFIDWSEDSSSLINEGTSIFPDFSVPSDDVYLSMLESQGEYLDGLTIQALQDIFKEFITVTNRQLNDFLEGGKFGTEVSEDTRASMKHCKLTNLISEHEFGDLDYSLYRRRGASLHYHSSLQIIKKNKTISGFLYKQPPEKQTEYLGQARKKAESLRKKHIDAEKLVKDQLMERMKEARRKKMEKQAKQDDQKNSLMSRISNHGGPCKCLHEVDHLLAKCETQKERQDVIKDQARYLKVILEIKDPRLIFARKSFEDLVSDLKGVLSNAACECEDDLEGPPTKKKKTDASQVKEFAFLDIDIWIAVAYEEAFFVGIVREINDKDVGVVQFLKRGPKDIYSWPRVEDICEIKAEYVFVSDFEVITGQGKRPKFTIPQIDYIDELYENFKELNFE